MRLGRDIAAGSASSLVSLAAGVLITPVYLITMGREAYGVIAFYASLQASLLALDGGVAITLTRRVAAELARGSQPSGLMHTLARGAWAVGVALALAMAASSGWLASGWLHLQGLDRAVVGPALALAGLALIGRYPTALYQAVLVGRHEIARASMINMQCTIISTLGAAALMYGGLADLRVLFAWQSAAALAQAMLLRHALLPALTPAEVPSKGEIARFLRSSLPAGGIGLTGMLLLQVDKLAASRVLPLPDFAVYSVAALVAGALYAFVMPVFNSVYPRLTSLATASGDALLKMYRDSSLAMASLLFPVAASLAAFGGPILRLWTGDARLAQDAAPLVLLLATGTALHGIMFVPFALKLARGASRMALAISAVTLLVSLPATVLFAVVWGGIGAAASWLAVMAAYCALGSVVTHRLVLPGVGSAWLLCDVLPAAIASLTAAGGAALASRTWPAWSAVVLAITVVPACWASFLLASPRLRRLLGGSRSAELRH